jgi:diguanylate cyclase (GGDEF)-like protein
VFQLTLWSIPPSIAAIITLTAYLRTRPRDQIPGAHALRFLFLTVFMWSAAQAMATLVPSPAAILLASKFAYVGIALTPVAWFLFAVTYSRRVRSLSRHVFNTISIIPGITIVLAMTNDWHGLIWQQTEFVTTDGFLSFVTAHGFWFYVHAVYSYSLVLIATAILGFALTQYKQHYQTLLAAIFAPIVAVMANLFSLSPLNPYPWLDLSTIGFLAAVFILDMGILRRPLLNTVPVARERVVEQLKDPVLVISHQGNVLDANQSAYSAWDTNDSLLGSNIAHLVELPIGLLLEPATNPETTIGQRTFEIASTLLDQTNPTSDVAIVFRDITERRESMRSLEQMKNKMEKMAHTDSLTNLYNRRFFIKRLNEEFERVKRHGTVMSVLIFDLDHFKRVNDTFGHDLGDAVLVAIADVVNNVKRISDVACRLGGEEFALLLPETDKIGAINLAQRLRRGIQDYPYEAKIEAPINITASIGVATITGDSKRPESILKTADRALYRAKDNGRNQVCVDNEPDTLSSL